MSENDIQVTQADFSAPNIGALPHLLENRADRANIRGKIVTEK